MELVALNEGLKLVEQGNLLPIEINIYSTRILSMLTTEILYYDALIDECMSRIRRLENSEVARCYRE